MISRLSLRLLRSYNQRLVLNQSKRAFSTHKTYRTLVSTHKLTHNLKPGYKFKTLSTVSHEFHHAVEVDKLQDEPKTKNPLWGLEYYINYMENNPDYHRLAFNIESVKEKTMDSKNELLLTFRNFIKNESEMNEQIVNDFKTKLMDERAWLNYYELTEIIHGLIYNETLKNNFQQQLMDMLTVLDIDCYNRINEHGYNKNLFLAQLWLNRDYKLKNTDKFFADKFGFKCRLKYLYKLYKLNKSQAVMLFYLVLKSRNFPPIENEFVLWTALENLLPDCTVEEIALISLTFHRQEVKGLTQKNNYVILNKLAEEITNCNENVVRDALKGVHFCLKFSKNHVPELEKFQQSLANSSERFSINLFLDALYLGISRNTCNKDLLNITLDRMKNGIDNCSLNTVGKLLHILTKFNLSDTELFDLVIKRLKNNLDTDTAHSIVFVAYNLVLQNVIPEETISKILSDDFQKELKMKRNDLARRLSAFLDVTLEIEKPDYIGSRMDEKSLFRMLQCIWFCTMNHKSFYTGRHIYSLEKAVVKYGGEENCVAYKAILPHFATTSVVLKLDKNLKGQEIPESYRKGTKSSLNGGLKPPDDEHYWLAFRLLKIDSYALDGGLTAREICYNRQLKKLGFIPIGIRFSEWYSNKDPSDQFQYVENKIKEALE